MKELGKSLSEHKFTVTRIYTSPQTRTMESSEELSKALGGVKIIAADDIDEAFAPGPYLEGMNMDEFAENKVNVYEEKVWGKYNHEKPSNIIVRMQRALMHIIKDLKNGETAIIMSHGDPIAWFINTLNGQEMPQPKNLREMIYPAKGEAVVLSTGQHIKISILYILPKEKHRKNIY